MLIIGEIESVRGGEGRSWDIWELYFPLSFYVSQKALKNKHQFKNIF